MEGHARSKPFLPGNSALHMTDGAASIQPDPKLVTLSSGERHDDRHIRRCRWNRIRLDEGPCSSHIPGCAHSFLHVPSRCLPLEPCPALQLEPRALPPFPLTLGSLRFRCFCIHRALTRCFRVSVHNLCPAHFASKRKNSPRRTFFWSTRSRGTSHGDDRVARGESTVSEKLFSRKSPPAIAA